MEYWDQLNKSGLVGGGERCEVIAALTFVWLNGDRVVIGHSLDWPTSIGCTVMQTARQ
jgi:hypothetical protein